MISKKLFRYFYDIRRFRFVQEFIANPLLIDGHAFDLGVFVLITSMDPLRIYRWRSDVLLRFCPEAYHPFDQENLRKYVVGENHLPFWEIPSLKVATQTFNFSALDAFNNHLEDEQLDVEKLWRQVDDAIVSIILSKATHLTRYSKIFQRRSQVEFFELLRFDFLVDEEMNLHLMEINMSPQLTPTNAQDELIRVMYEQLLFNTISILGIDKRVEMKPK